MLKATYDINKSYVQNYDEGPIVNFSIPKDEFSLPKLRLWYYNVNSPIGIPAGPLLNSKYIKLYSRLGFDILVYKTVRTVETVSHPSPNCLFINSKSMITEKDIGSDVLVSDIVDFSDMKNVSVTNSFGIPSKAIEVWQEDIQKANSYLLEGQLMIVSCVGTQRPEISLLNDFVFCAQKAVEAGAKAIELNFSCPNVVSKEGSIYQDPILSSEISRSVKKAIKNIPLIIKIGYIQNKNHLLKIIKSNAPFIDGISALNTISMKVRDKNGNQALPGKGRLKSGICGRIIKSLSLDMTREIYRINQSHKFDLTLCGVGGITSDYDIDEYLRSGADIAMTASGSMWDPMIAYNWKKRKKD